GIAGPAVLADRPRQRRIADACPHLEAEAEAQARRTTRPVEDMVGGHEGERLLADDALALEGAAIGQRRREAQVVANGAEHAAAARFVLRAVTVLEARRHRLAVRARAGLGRAPDLGRRYLEARIDHAERLVDALVQSHRELLAGDDLDQAAQHVDRHAILPAI